MDLPPTFINTSRHHLISLPACPASKKSCCHDGKREVPWLWQVVLSDWTTPDVPQSLSVSDGGTCLPAETCCRMPQWQQWHWRLNRNNNCCFCPWGWWWYVYSHVHQRCQEAMTHRPRRWQPTQRNISNDTPPNEPMVKSRDCKENADKCMAKHCDAEDNVGHKRTAEDSMSDSQWWFTLVRGGWWSK